MKWCPSERGQVVVLIAFGLVVLLAFVALALDVGMLYVHRRQAQNAADAAVMAAALARAKGKDWQAAGQAQAAANGFDAVNDPNVSSVEVISPPTIEPYKSVKERDQYIQVTIVAEVDSLFAHLIFAQPLRNTVVSIARARPPVNPAPGVALYGTSKSACRTAWFSGNGKFTLTGGGVFSNSVGSQNSPPCESGYQDGSGTVFLIDEDIALAGYFANSGEGGSIEYGSGELKEDQPQQEWPTIPEVPCPSSAQQPPLTITTDTTLDPGNYSSISIEEGASLTLNPGIYCVDGKFGGQSGSVTGLEVTIKMLQSEMDFGGNITVNIQAPESGTWKGLVIYAEPEVSLLRFTGASNSYYKGTVYAPWSACEIHGTVGNTLVLDSQLICDTIKGIAEGDVEVTYLPENLYILPNTIELAN